MNDNDIEVRLEEQLTVVIVEDHVLFRDFLQKTCSQVFGLKVLGTVGMGSDCLELCKRECSLGCFATRRGDDWSRT